MGKRTNGKLGIQKTSGFWIKHDRTQSFSDVPAFLAVSGSLGTG